MVERNGYLKMEAVRRIFVEKKQGFDVEAQGVLEDLRENLSLKNLEYVRVLNRYDVSGISDEEYKQAGTLVFFEPPVDAAYNEEISIGDGELVFAVEYLPGQFDQRAASAEECISILTQKERPTVRSAKVYILKGITGAELERVKAYLINPVEAREASLDKPQTLVMEQVVPEDVKTVAGFIGMSDADLEGLRGQMGFAMDLDDLRFCQEYFKDTERRDPTVTELRMIDTYWSDHCRHTTFSTRINRVHIPDGKYSAIIKSAFEDYLAAKKELYAPDRDTCLMNMATIIVKQLKKAGKLKEIDESEEINACSIVVDVDVDGQNEPWLIMFKNETHNHPTEIEPFGGAATCLGGAIRDPLSGRSYVYQAMRVTGSGDPRVSLQDTRAGKLMQRKITKGAAAGYSSYGNQIGLATGQVVEIYDEGYVAKRMEIGAVIGAAPKKNVVREAPEAGDVIILLGGRTGRDGCGGATGSSKAHTEESIMTCGSEVQKGNPPVERKIQRLFRDEKVTTLIKRCNDFGAGGVSVAIGELADGLVIDLDKVPKKYEGLDGTELAISESQERMAVVVRAADVEQFIKYANEENLEATQVAAVTEEARLVMHWRGKTICDISRAFLNTNGATKNTDVEVVLPEPEQAFFRQAPVADVKKQWLDVLGDLNVCSQKGLAERFDSTIGANTVLMPFGGKYQLTPAEGMAAKVPVLAGETNTATVMTFGYNPKLSSWSPYHGAAYAVVESVSKAVALGADYKEIYLTFQEYFERLGTDPKRWGKPFAALLGAYKTQLALGIAAIGGKDSMSGSFNELDVPPTLVSFAVAPVKADKVVSQELKSKGSKLVLLRAARDENDLPDFDRLKQLYETVHALTMQGKVLSASIVKGHGLAETVAKMAFGNKIGVRFADTVTAEQLFAADIGSIVLEIAQDTAVPGGTVIAHTTDEAALEACDVSIGLEEAVAAWTAPLEKVFPTKAGKFKEEPKTYQYTRSGVTVASEKFAKPRVFIPVFPGTNCEYDTARAFERAGGVADVFVIRNLTPEDVSYSMREMQKRIAQAQIVMIPGGFSGGDEPDGSGKFIATAFRNPLVKEEVMHLIKDRDGLMLGICNGFQALIKLGLVPFGEILDPEETYPTLTFNTIGRHVSCMVETRIASDKSPWFKNVKAGDTHMVAVSHGEGRFIASEAQIRALAENGQIATQYVNPQGQATYDIRYNPNGSLGAIEGITSPDGRILGKMGHTERAGKNVFTNIPGDKDQKLFLSGVEYFK
ncbi:MAG TPA: phosphoribosylformylglycinamidine synthase [Candidatus Avimonoglobus intestinipullorum]|uniref:Phosphoribosylformylglycinamidine synthase n=1 Tax=Candidatus Avimonoglobus intestinipullorum TaxID=2840699 RepID=A0A9D1S626_9FIRM|nr:phosphoribosylformylglycinamidine synthase [Candidatus Avimonoglobus intestinipullorum]